MTGSVEVGFVARISLLVSGIFLMLSTAPAAADDIDDVLQSLLAPDNPVGYIIRDFPEEREAAEARLRAAAGQGGGAGLEAVAYRIGVELGAKYTSHYAGQAADDAILGFLDMQIQSIAELATRSGALCLGWLTGTVGQVEFSPAVVELQASRFLDLVSAGSFTGRAQRLLAPEDMEALNTAIVEAMIANFPSDHTYFHGMGNPAAVTDPARQLDTCNTFLAFFKSVAALPPGDAAAYFRTTLAAG